jgi:hypothetical protein
MATDRHPWRRRPDPAPERMSRTDLWLQRLSAIAQIGLCLLAAFGLFYTVIPLYKSALLEEEIARKTRELERTQSALDQSYHHLRDQRVKLYIFKVGGPCTELMRSSRKLDEPQTRWQYLAEPHGIAGNRTNGLWKESWLFGVNCRGGSSPLNQPGDSPRRCSHPPIRS